MSPMATGGLLALLVFQAVAALMVMRAASERDDLGGMARLMPVLIAFLVPVIGPFFASRGVDAGMRPVLMSLIGGVVGLGLFVAGGGAVPAPPMPQMAAQPAEGQPTEGQPAEGAAPVEGQPAEGAAPVEGQPVEGAAPVEGQPAETPAAQPAPEAQPAPAAQPAPTATEAAALGATSPATAPAAPQSAAPVATATTADAAANRPAGLTAAGAAATAAMPAAGTPQVVRIVEGDAAPSPGEPVVFGGIIARSTLRLPSSEGLGAKFIQVLPREGTKGLGYARLQFAALFGAAPGMGGQRSLYLGGRVLDHSQLAVDYFEPYAIDVRDVAAGQSFTLLSMRGLFLIEATVEELALGDDGAPTNAVVDVRVR